MFTDDKLILQLKKIFKNKIFFVSDLDTKKIKLGINFQYFKERNIINVNNITESFKDIINKVNIKIESNNFNYEKDAKDVFNMSNFLIDFNNDIIELNNDFYIKVIIRLKTSDQNVFKNVSENVFDYELIENELNKFLKKKLNLNNFDKYHNFFNDSYKYFINMNQSFLNKYNLETIPIGLNTNKDNMMFFDDFDKSISYIHLDKIRELKFKDFDYISKIFNIEKFKVSKKDTKIIFQNLFNKDPKILNNENYIKIIKLIKQFQNSFLSNLDQNEIKLTIIFQENITTINTIDLKYNFIFVNIQK